MKSYTSYLLQNSGSDAEDLSFYLLAIQSSIRHFRMEIMCWMFSKTQNWAKHSGDLAGTLCCMQPWQDGQLLFHRNAGNLYNINTHAQVRPQQPEPPGRQRESSVKGSLSLPPRLQGNASSKGKHGQGLSCHGYGGVVRTCLGRRSEAGDGGKQSQKLVA